jgi:hypothetical protein
VAYFKTGDFFFAVLAFYIQLTALSSRKSFPASLLSAKDITIIVVILSEVFTYIVIPDRCFSPPPPGNPILFAICTSTFSKLCKERIK